MYNIYQNKKVNNVYKTALEAGVCVGNYTYSGLRGGLYV
jgi:hypothetical protein